MFLQYKNSYVTINLHVCSANEIKAQRSEVKIRLKPKHISNSIRFNCEKSNKSKHTVHTSIISNENDTESCAMKNRITPSTSDERRFFPTYPEHGALSKASCPSFLSSRLH